MNCWFSYKFPLYQCTVCSLSFKKLVLYRWNLTWESSDSCSVVHKQPTWIHQLEWFYCLQCCSVKRSHTVDTVRSMYIHRTVMSLNHWWCHWVFLTLVTCYQLAPSALAEKDEIKGGRQSYSQSAMEIWQLARLTVARLVLGGTGWTISPLASTRTIPALTMPIRMFWNSSPNQNDKMYVFTM